MRHSEHRSSGIGHTDNRLDHEHSVHRSRSARSNAVDHRSILLNCSLQEHRSELEHGLTSNRTRHGSDVSRSSWRNSSTHRATIPLRHADPSEHSTASVLMHRRVRSRSHSYDSVFLRRHSRASSRSRGKKKLHRRGNTLSLLVLLIATPPPLLLEKEQGNGTSLKRRNTLVYVLLNVTNVRRNTRGRGVLLHLLLPLLQFSSDSFSSQQRSSARKKSRNCSRSLSSADENPHDPAPTTECPALPRDHISRYADDDDEFNSHFEDHQDLAPEDEAHNVFEIHSNVSSEDMRFQNFIEEVFSFFFWPTSSQRKQMRFWEGTG